MHRLRSVLLGTGILGLTAVVFAPTASAIGELYGLTPSAGNSWTQGVLYRNFTTHDTIEFFIVDDQGGGPWNDPPITNFQGSTNWASQRVNTNYALAEGDPLINGSRTVGGGNWDARVDLQFDGDIGQTVTVDWLFWSGGGYGVGNLVGTIRLTVGGGQFNARGIQNFDVDGYNRAGEPVPEPATLALFGLGLVGVSRVVRRRRHKST